MYLPEYDQRCDKRLKAGGSRLHRSELLKVESPKSTGVPELNFFLGVVEGASNNLELRAHEIERARAVTTAELDAALAPPLSIVSAQSRSALLSIEKKLAVFDGDAIPSSRPPQSRATAPVAQPHRHGPPHRCKYFSSFPHWKSNRLMARSLVRFLR